MGEASIMSALIRAGLTKEGAAGVVGNLRAESALSSINVEDRSGIADGVYVAQVDSGQRDRYAFSRDSYGFGLAQWTYWSRKEALYDFAKKKNKSIGDETMQVEFLLVELEQYSALMALLKTTKDVNYAAQRVCADFENPAIHNIADRQRFAREALSRWDGGSTADAVTESKPVTYAVYANKELVSMPILSQGSKGVAVGMAQMALEIHGFTCGKCDCDFGPKMLNSVNSFKAARGINNVGVNYGKINKEVWEALYK